MDEIQLSYGCDGQLSSINRGMHPSMGCLDRLELVQKKTPHYTPPR